MQTVSLAADSGHDQSPRNTSFCRERPPRRSVNRSPERGRARSLQEYCVTTGVISRLGGYQRSYGEIAHNVPPYRSPCPAPIDSPHGSLLRFAMVSPGAGGDTHLPVFKLGPYTPWGLLTARVPCPEPRPRGRDELARYAAARSSASPSANCFAYMAIISAESF